MMPGKIGVSIEGPKFVLRITAANLLEAEVPEIERMVSRREPCAVGYSPHADCFVAALLGYRAFKEVYEKGYRYGLERVESDRGHDDGVRADTLVQHWSDEDYDLTWVWNTLCPKMATSFMAIESILKYASDRWGQMALNMSSFGNGHSSVAILNRQSGLNVIQHDIGRKGLKECVYLCLRDAYNAELTGEFNAKENPSL